MAFDASDVAQAAKLRDHARKLELERNEARASARQEKEHHEFYRQKCSDYMGAEQGWLKVQAERNASLADAAAMREALSIIRCDALLISTEYLRQIQCVTIAECIENIRQKSDSSLSTNAGRKLLAELQYLQGKLNCLEQVSASPMEDPDLDWIDAMRRDKAAAVQGLNSTLLAQLEAKSDLVKLVREEMFLKNSELQSALVEVEWLRQELALAQIPTTVDAVEREEWRQERDALLRKVEAAKEMAEALESCRANVEHEIRRRELLKQSTDQWPDVLTGCVSGGGINAAITAWQEANRDHPPHN